MHSFFHYNQYTKNSFIIHSVFIFVIYTIHVRILFSVPVYNTAISIKYN